MKFFHFQPQMGAMEFAGCLFDQRHIAVERHEFIRRIQLRAEHAMLTQQRVHLPADIGQCIEQRLQK